MFLIPLLLLVSGCVEKPESQENVIKVVKLSPRDMVEQLRLGEIDGYVAWEPFVSDAVVNGYGRIVVTSSDIWPNHPCCVIAARKGVDKDTLIALVWAHVKATRFINNESNRDKVLDYAAEFTGMSREIVSEAISRIKFIEFPDRKEFKNYYERLSTSGYLKSDLSELGYKNEDEFFSDFLYDEIYRYVASKLEEDKNWKPQKVNTELRVGYLTADLHQLAFYIALKEGYFDEVGLKVEKREYQNGVYEMEGFKLGEIDAGYLGSAPATLKRVNDNIPIRVVAGVNNEGSAIVAREAKNLKQLGGKEVAIPGFGTVQDFLLRMAAEKEGLRVET
jgi:NitT/TauT family transport system substrate-binding protein